MDIGFWSLIFWISVLTVVYVYAGFPLLLVILNAIGLKKPVRISQFTPKVTLIISAYNEETVIQCKLQNVARLDYPKERLDVMVVSDCSSDRTDEIVEAFTERPVKLLRLPERRGKTYGLNLAVAEATGEIIVFSDANAMYEPDVIRKMTRNFADTKVGAVTGESRYRIGDDDPSTESEVTYWNYELWLKRLESSLGSLVGGDGAILAIRKELHHELHPDDLSDFINPMQVVIRGYRNVYETEAVCYEGGATNYGAEFRRKVRIVNRAWRAMIKVRELLNPFRYGFFAVQFLSHKVLRWLVTVWMILALIANLMLAGDSLLYVVTLTGQLAFYAAAVTGLILHVIGRWNIRIFTIPYYFCIVNIASLLGILQAMRGQRYTTWNVSRAEGSRTTK
jgi:cellulose synthase/poly-beta-1,6-N-acetylglucosamine synthase-like glycosyltransferase